MATKKAKGVTSKTTKNQATAKPAAAPKSKGAASGAKGKKGMSGAC